MPERIKRAGEHAAQTRRARRRGHGTPGAANRLTQWARKSAACAASDSAWKMVAFNVSGSNGLVTR